MINKLIAKKRNNSSGVKPDPQEQQGVQMPPGSEGAATMLESNPYFHRARLQDMMTPRTRTQQPAAPSAEKRSVLIGPGAEFDGSLGNCDEVVIEGTVRGTPRPRGRYVTEGGGQIAFKTGTSSGYRDALAVGFDATHTVGVWMGDPGARPMPGKTGANAAAPILFRIFDALASPDRRKTVVDAPAFPRQAPINLKALRSARGVNEVSNSTPFSIAFPVDGSRIPLRQGSSSPAAVFPIKMRDGQRPFSVFVNEKPIKVGNLTRSVAWTPEARGYYSIVAVDRIGNVAVSRVVLSAR